MGTPSKGTPADQRLKVNNPNAGKSTASKPASTSKSVHTEKYEQERQRQKDGGVTTQQG